MAGLYSACDCLVHPFRGEGFGLPVVEAMACGLPVIVTGAGPALDYASEKTAFLIPAERKPFPERRVGDLETIGRPWLFEPDMDALGLRWRNWNGSGPPLAPRRCASRTVAIPTAQGRVKSTG